jgi:hypothetical protein
VKALNSGKDVFSTAAVGFAIFRRGNRWCGYRMGQQNLRRRNKRAFPSVPKRGVPPLLARRSRAPVSVEMRWLLSRGGVRENSFAVVCGAS